MQGFNNYITVDEIVASACTILPETTREERESVFPFWIWMAAKKLGFSGQNEKTETITVLENFIRKPKDHLYTIDMALFDSAGSEIKYIYREYSRKIHKNSRDENHLYVYEDDHCIHIDDCNSNIDCITLKYYSVPVDEDGNPKINEEHLEAIMHFIRYMRSLASNNNQSEIEINRRRWLSLKDYVKGNNKMPSPLRSKHILNKWMSLIPDFREFDNN